MSGKDAFPEQPWTGPGAPSIGIDIAIGFGVSPLHQRESLELLAAANPKGDGKMSDDWNEEKIPPEPPARKMSVKGCAAALGGAVILALIVSYVLKLWGSS